ncbi:MAG: response regulator [Verrucomicrobiota bacterium]
MPDQAAEILLVEDSPDDVAFFFRTFEKAGFTARLRAVPDGAEALDFLFATGRYAGRNRALRPRLVVLDLKLPKLSGLEVLRRLKNQSGNTNHPCRCAQFLQEEARPHRELRRREQLHREANGF